MERRFLRKNVIFGAVTIGALLVGGALLLNREEETNTPTGALDVTNAAEHIVSRTALIDSDGDGLKDWEEVLLKTDPRNPDTDGDGILDGQENKGVELKTFNGIDRSKVDALPNTEKLAFQLFEGYIDLKQQRYLGTNIQENFVAGLIESSLPTISYKIYTENDVVAALQSATDPKTSALTYKTTLHAAWKPLFSVTEDELITFARIIDNGDTSGFSQLTFAKSKYTETIQNMLNLSVPANVVSIHVDMLNAFSFFIGVLDTMIHVDDDPLTALVAIDGYTRGEDRIKASIERFKTYLLTSGVTI